MKNCNLKQVFRALLILLGFVLSTTALRAQLTGTKTIPTDYASIAAFVTDLNAQGVGPGGVTLDIPSGYTETAPAGGFSITATGTAANPIIIHGVGGAPQPIVTASAALTAGALNDAIFKIIGGDYITLAGIDLRENAANTTTTAASNNMTEWGIALLYASATDNGQFITLSGNTITLNRTYQNTFGIYANATHTAAAPTTNATATGALGGNSGLKIYNNAISNVNIGIVVVGPTGAADINDGVEIGGTVSTGNTITNFGTTGTFSGYSNVSGTVNGILIRNSKNFTVSYNTITSSAGGTTSGTLRGVFVPGFNNTPTGTFTNNINNNSISLQSGFAGGTIEAIAHPSGSASSTSVLNINNNDFANFGHTAGSPSGSITFISQASTHFTFSANNNTFTNLNVATTGSVTFISHSYSMPASGTTNINNNAIIGGFTKTGAGGTVTLATTGASSPNGTFANYLNNNFSNISVTGATGITGINSTDGAGTSPTKVLTGNTFNNWTGGTSSITAVNITYINGTSSLSNNTFTSITGQSTITVLSLGSSFNGANPWLISNNTISGITSAGTGGSVTGISCSNTSPLIRIAGNTIHTMSSTGSNLVCGISITGATSTMVSANKIYGLSTSNAGGTVFAIQVTSGSSVSVYNNVIGGLTAPIASGTDVIRGISVSSSSTGTIGVYYNSIYLNASSSGTNFGTSGIFHAASATAATATLDLRNNIIINQSTAAGTGLTVAFRRSGIALGNYAATSNRNLLYAGTPSATNLVMADGTNAYQTLATYQAAVGTRDANSITGEAFTYATPGSFFISLTGAAADFLKPVAGITTQVEGGAANISTPAITADYASVVRAGNAGYAGTGTLPDMGAFEFEGVTPAPVITLNSVTPPATSQCTASARLVSMNVTTLSGTITTVNLNYSVNGVAQTPIAMTNTSGTTWQATIPVPAPVNATIAWSVTATNTSGLSTGYTGAVYADEPLLGAVAYATGTPAGPVCAGTPTSLMTKLEVNGTVVSGAGGSTSSSSSVSPFYHGYGGVKTQYIFRASELTAMGLTAGNITAISLNVTTLGTPALNSFTLNIGHTAQNAAVTNAAILTGLTQVFAASPLTLVTGVNTITFSTPFTWDGTSNIVLSFNYSNVNTGGTSTAVTTDPAVSFTSSMAIYADNASATCLFTAAASGQPCMGTNSNGTSSTRPALTFAGNKSLAIQAVSWSDGVTTVGTTNPLIVTPMTTTTYTANITSSGCLFSPSPTTTVTTIALPSAPTATNSGQCGSQVPTASVASTTGLPTPTFNWYAAASGGSALQSGTSTTYTSVVSTTTTFYVSELNTGTGCESPRTAVTVTVASADPIAAVAAPTSVCLGQSFTLTASNTAGTPLQNYAYSFESATPGSGAETPVAGNPVTITPTASGNITYTVTGVDGLCAATNTVTVNVKPLPVLAATATPGTVCSGDPIALSLTATDYTVGGTVTVGTQTTTEFGGGVYRNGFGAGDFRHQLIFTAAELTAAGVQPGNITAINFYVTSVGSGSANNYTIRMGNTAATGATTTFLADPTTQVYMAATYTAVNGTNTHTFSTPFNWDGTSNVLIDICYNISVVGGSSTLAATTPSVSRNSNLLGSAGACSAATGSTFANRPLVGFTGNVFTNINGTSTILWAPGGFTTPTASTSVTNNTAGPITQAYTVTVTNPATGCTNTATTASVTINPATVAPVASNSTQCGNGVPTASVTGSGAPGNTFRWYTVPTGGTAIAGQSGSTLSGYTITTTTTFYVSEYNGTCESPRTAVTATVTTPPAVAIAGSTNLCIGSSQSLTASSSNDPNYTYTWSGGLGTGATVTAAPAVSTTYTVTAVDMSGGANNGCNTTATISITVNPVPTGVTASASDNTICNGESVTLTSTPSSAPVSLLTQNFDAGFGSWTTAYSGTAPVATQWLVQNAPYTYDGSMDFLNFATPQGGGFAMTNADLGASGLRTRAALTSPSFSTVGMNTATLTFQNLYQRWASGDSAVAVQVSTNGGTSWTNLKEYFALGVNQGTVTNNAQVMANESIVLGAALMNQPDVRIRFYYVSSWGYYWMLDNIQLTGTPEALTYAWTSSPAGYSATVQNPVAPVSPTVTTTYTMTATNTFGCTTSASTTVTVNQPTASSTPITACEEYTWTDGVTYNTSGTYTQTLTNAAGCDSVATLVLTINQPTASTTTITECESYTWTNGTEYTTSGTYTQMLTNANGCDSIATLVLTINQPTSSTTTVTACNAYTWTDGTEYTISGTYTQTLTNANGCDSIATLELTISTVVTSTTTETACDSYTWTDGVVYTTSGTYTQDLTSVGGCDSIATLELTINYSTTSTTTASACEEYTWTDGITYNTSGTYTQTLTNAAGCDSIATLVLTINQPTSSTTTASACEEYTWTDGNTYTASGTYTQTLTDANGCDSIATLVLTITGNPVATATDNGDLTITASAGTSYQWVHCATGLPIAGATSQTFTVTVNGSYAVVVTNANGCSDTSNCVTIDDIGIDELTDASIRVFPNPTRSDVTVTMSSGSATIEVADAKGKLLQTIEVKNGEKVDLSAYETGVYFLRIRTDNGSAIERIVKN